MNACPSDEELRRFIDADSPAPEFERHLDTCASCRQRLDALAGVTALRGVDAKPPQHDSVSLMRAMADLERAAEERPPSLPGLALLREPGFIGKLGEIKIRRVIGRGGMGIVYEGFDAKLERTVAVKVLSPHLLNSADARVRFLREAKAAAALTHENIVTIHAVDETHEPPFLVLQYVPGESLQDRVQRDGKLPFDEVVRIGIQIARGLAAAHARQLVHRDIKPANILLDATSGQVRIADFGLAKHLGLESLSATDVIAGTPAFMAPEQAVNDPVDGRADLFSLGVLLYYISTGVQPFDGSSPFVILDRIRTATPRPLATLDGSLPGWFCALIDQLLQKQRDKRIASAVQVVKRLEERSSPAAPATRATAWRYWIAGGIAALALAGVGLGFSNDWWRTPPEAQPPALTKPAGFLVDGTATPFTTLTEAIAAARDGTVITIHGDGPFQSEPIEIRGKRLTLRASPGATPVIVPEPPIHAIKHGFIRTDADLRLEGLEIRWPIEPALGKLEAKLERSTLTSTKSRLTLIHCRVTCGQVSSCVRALEGELVLEHCHLLSPTGYGVVWQPSSAPLRVHQCVFEGTTGTLIRLSSLTEKVVTRADFTQNTLLAERAWILQLDAAPPPRPLVLNVQRCLVDSANPVGMFLYGPKKLTVNATPQTLIRAAIAWSEDGNAYRKGCDYFTSSTLPRVLEKKSSEIQPIEKWLAFWQINEQRSIEATIHFKDRPETLPMPAPTVDRLEGATGPLPADYGADASQVGPGVPYHGWASKQRKS